MISYLQDKFDNIYAFIEWEVVDEKGQFKNLGEYIYIQELWIHPRYRRLEGILPILINMIDEHKFSTNAQKIYWMREKHNHHLKTFSRFRLAKMGRKEFIYAQ